MEAFKIDYFTRQKILWKFIQVVVTEVYSLLLLSSIPYYGCLFNHSSIEGYLVCSQFEAIMNEAAINVHVLPKLVFISLR